MTEVIVEQPLASPPGLLKIFITARPGFDPENALSLSVGSITLRIHVYNPADSCI